MTETKIGTPLRDGQHDPPPCCSVCGASPTVRTSPSTTRSLLFQVPDSRGANMTRLVCERCAERAMKSVGAGRGRDALSTRDCSATHGADDDTRFQIVAVWPKPSFSPPPYWMACAHHLNAALDALAPEEPA